MNFKSNLRQGKNNIYIGFRRQTCEKLSYLNIYLRFALENLFCIKTNFSPVIWKGMIDPQNSQNEILGYSSWIFAFVYSFMIPFTVNFTASLPFRQFFKRKLFKLLSKTFKNVLYYWWTRNKDARSYQVSLHIRFEGRNKKVFEFLHVISKNLKQLLRLDFGLRLAFLKCHGKCLEEHFWASRFQNFLGGTCPQTPSAARAFSARNLPRLVLKSGYGPASLSLLLLHQTLPDSTGLSS